MWREPVLKCWHIKPTAQSNLYSLQWQMAASYTFLPIKSQIYFGKSCKTRVADFSPLDKSATCLNIYLEIVTKIGITFPPAKCTVFGWSQVRFLPGGRQLNLPILVNIFSPHHYYAQVPYNLSQYCSVEKGFALHCFLWLAQLAPGSCLSCISGLSCHTQFANNSAPNTDCLTMSWQDLEGLVMLFHQMHLNHIVQSVMCEIYIWIVQSWTLLVVAVRILILTMAVIWGR